MLTYKIVDWDRKYEVNSKGGVAGQGDEFCKKSLSFYRTEVTGASQDLDYIKLLGIANSRAQEIYGIYHRLVNISSGQKRDSRGIIQHSINDLAIIIGTTQEKMRGALAILCDPDLMLLEKLPGKPGNSGSSGEVQGKPGALYNENGTKTKLNNNKNETNEEDIWFDFLKSYFSPSVRLVALQWSEVVRPLLRLKNKGDVSCLSDIARWLADQVEAGEHKIRIFDMAWQWVVDSQSGEVPMRVFQARLNQEIGYECKSKRAEK